MSITKELQSVSEVLHLTYRPSQVYSSVTGAYTIFSIDGAVSLVTLGGRITAAAGGAVTITTTINTIAGDAGATNIAGAVGTIVWIPLNVAGTLLNAAGAPKTIATGTPEMVAGCQTAGGLRTPGLIVVTFAVSTATMDWFCVWRKLTPNSRVY
jgi:hypothetical protein